MNFAAFLVFCMLIIQSLIINGYSGQIAKDSAGSSMKIVEQIENIIGIKSPKMASGNNLFHFLIRKCAHFYNFFIIGVLLFMSLKAMNWGIRQQNFLVVLGGMIAVFDEIHQNFVPGRSGQIQDVCLDFAGVLFGMCFMTIIWGIIFKRGVISEKKRKCYSRNK